MPGQSLDIDREAVRAHVITYGVREAARAFNLSPGTVGAWSARGKWLEPVVASQTPAISLPKSMQPIANSANSPSQAARNSLASQSSRTKLNLSRAALKGSIAAARKDGQAIIEQSQQIKALAQTAAMVHGWDQQKTQAGPLVSLNFTSSMRDVVELVTDGPSAGPDVQLDQLGQ